MQQQPLACTVYCAQLGGRVLHCTAVQWLHSTEARCRLCVIQRYWGRVRQREDGAWISWQGWGCCTHCTSLYCTVQRPPLSLELSDWLKQTQVTLQQWCDAAFPDLNLIYYFLMLIMNAWNSKHLWEALWLTMTMKIFRTNDFPSPSRFIWMFPQSRTNFTPFFWCFWYWLSMCRSVITIRLWDDGDIGTDCVTSEHLTSARHCAKLTLCSHFISLQTKQRSSVHHKYGIRLSCWCFCPTWS